MLLTDSAAQNTSVENFSDGMAEEHILIVQKLATIKC
jgi:hypothetical protein